MLRYYRRSLALVLVLAFLAVQTVLVMHIAKYGNGKHEHNGTTCSIYLFAEHNPFTETFAASALMAPLFAAIAIVIFISSVYKPESFLYSYARAPPFFLQF